MNYTINEIIQSLNAIATAKGGDYETNVVAIAPVNYCNGAGCREVIEVDTAEIDDDIIIDRMESYAAAVQEAESRKAYYESDDFKGDYQDCLLDIFWNDATANKERIVESLGEFICVERQLIEDNYKDIVEFIYDNPMFRDSYGYGRCDDDIATVSFGEQEEQIDNFTDDRKRAYEAVDYCVNADKGDSDGHFYAYMDLTSQGVSLYLGYMGSELAELKRIANGIEVKS